MKKYVWKCPKCGATLDKCGKGPCESQHHTQGEAKCLGLICACEDDKAGDDHGETLADPCLLARCWHCSWSGPLPAEKVEDPLKLLREVLNGLANPGALPAALRKRIEKRLRQGT